MASPAELIQQTSPANGTVAGGPRLSVSKQRAKNFSSAGLSELSKQLRIFQAKNEAQAVEINRLERQLRILAELQGISVADLRKALEDACANEAFGEMQHRVAKLRAELEAATLLKQKELRMDATAPHIANLELRVGELEEVEEKQQAEIHHLYEELRHERARATRLESENDQHKKDSQDYLDKLKREAARASRLESSFEEKMSKLEEEQALLLKQQAEQANANSAAGAGSSAAISPEMAAEYERLLRSLQKKDEALRRAQEMLKSEQDKANGLKRQVDDKAREAEMNMKVDNDKMALTIKELQDADSQNELRLAQYKARFAMQDERIEDMGQQLDSLYTAFELLRDEFNAENRKFNEMKNNLDDADAAVARQMDSSEKKRSSVNGTGTGAAHNTNGMMGSTTRNSVAASTNSNNHSNGNHYNSKNGINGSSENDDGMIPRIITTPNTPGTMATESTSASRSPSTAYAMGLPLADAYAANSTAGSAYGGSASGGADGGSGDIYGSSSARDAYGSNSARDAYGNISARDAYGNISARDAYGNISARDAYGNISARDAYGSNGTSDNLAGPYGSPYANPYLSTPPSATAYATPDTKQTRTPTTWQLLRGDRTNSPQRNSRNFSQALERDNVLISGVLIVKSKSAFRKWKSKHAALYLNGDHYQLDIGEGKSFALEFGISKVEFFANHPLSFVVYTNPSDTAAPVIYAAATNEGEYNRWMSSLTKATNGEDYEVNSLEAGPRRASQRISNASVAAAQEASDLERALALSKQQV